MYMIVRSVHPQDLLYVHDVRSVHHYTCSMYMMLDLYIHKTCSMYMMVRSVHPLDLLYVHDVRSVHPLDLLYVHDG